MARSTWLRSTLVAATILLSSGAAGQPLSQEEAPPQTTTPIPALAGPSEIDRDAARTLVQQGDERLKAEDYEGALVAYRRADDIMGVPTTSIEVGRVAERLGRWLEARAAFERAAAHPPLPDEPEPFTQAREQAALLLADLLTRIPTLALAVEGPPASSVELVVDGERREDWARPLPLDPGTHRIEARAEGFLPRERTITLEERQARRLTLRLPPEPVEEPLQPPNDDEVPGPWWPLAISGLSLAGAGLVVGAVTGGLSLADASTAKDACDESGACAPEAEEPLSRSRALAHVSTTSFVLAAAGAALGGAMLVVILTEDDDGGAEEVPDAQLHLGPFGVGLRGRF